jgi:hypothetical protein
MLRSREADMTAVEQMWEDERADLTAAKADAEDAARAAAQEEAARVEKELEDLREHAAADLLAAQERAAEDAARLREEIATAAIAAEEQQQLLLAAQTAAAAAAAEVAATVQGVDDDSNPTTSVGDGVPMATTTTGAGVKGHNTNGSPVGDAVADAELMARNEELEQQLLQWKEWSAQQQTQVEQWEAWAAQQQQQQEMPAASDTFPADGHLPNNDSSATGEPNDDRSVHATAATGSLDDGVEGATLSVQDDEAVADTANLQATAALTASTDTELTAAPGYQMGDDNLSTFPEEGGGGGAQQTHTATSTDITVDASWPPATSGSLPPVPQLHPTTGEVTMLPLSGSAATFAATEDGSWPPASEQLGQEQEPLPLSADAGGLIPAASEGAAGEFGTAFESGTAGSGPPPSPTVAVSEETAAPTTSDFWGNSRADDVPGGSSSAPTAATLTPPSSPPTASTLAPPMFQQIHNETGTDITDTGPPQALEWERDTQPPPMSVDVDETTTSLDLPVPTPFDQPSQSTEFEPESAPPTPFDPSGLSVQIAPPPVSAVVSDGGMFSPAQSPQAGSSAGAAIGEVGMFNPGQFSPAQSPQAGAASEVHSHSTGGKPRTPQEAGPPPGRPPMSALSTSPRMAGLPPQGQHQNPTSSALSTSPPVAAGAGTSVGVGAGSMARSVSAVERGSTGEHSTWRQLAAAGGDLGSHAQLRELCEQVVAGNAAALSQHATTLHEGLQGGLLGAFPELAYFEFEPEVSGRYAELKDRCVAQMVAACLFVMNARSDFVGGAELTPETWDALRAHFPSGDAAAEELQVVLVSLLLLTVGQHTSLQNDASYELQRDVFHPVRVVLAICGSDSGGDVAVSAGLAGWLPSFAGLEASRRAEVASVLEANFQLIHFVHTEYVPSSLVSKLHPVSPPSARHTVLVVGLAHFVGFQIVGPGANAGMDESCAHVAAVAMELLKDHCAELEEEKVEPGSSVSQDLAVALYHRYLTERAKLVKIKWDVKTSKKASPGMKSGGGTHQSQNELLQCRVCCWCRCYSKMGTSEVLKAYKALAPKIRQNLSQETSKYFRLGPSQDEGCATVLEYATEVVQAISVLGYARFKSQTKSVDAIKAGLEMLQKMLNCAKLQKPNFKNKIGAASTQGRLGQFVLDTLPVARVVIHDASSWGDIDAMVRDKSWKQQIEYRGMGPLELVAEVTLVLHAPQEPAAAEGAVPLSLQVPSQAASDPATIAASQDGQTHSTPADGGIQPAAIMTGPGGGGGGDGSGGDASSDFLRRPASDRTDNSAFQTDAFGHQQQQQPAVQFQDPVAGSSGDTGAEPPHPQHEQQPGAFFNPGALSHPSPSSSGEAPSFFNPTKSPSANNLRQRRSDSALSSRYCGDGIVTPSKARAKRGSGEEEAPTTTHAKSMKDSLTAFYTAHVPDKLKNVPMILEAQKDTLELVIYFVLNLLLLYGCFLQNSLYSTDIFC